MFFVNRLCNTPFRARCLYVVLATALFISMVPGTAPQAQGNPGQP